MRSRIKRSVYGLVVWAVFAGVVMLVGCSSEDATEIAPTSEPGYDQQASSSYSAGLTANGILLPSRRVELGFGVGGFVESVPVMVGEQVTAGQALATLDAAGLQRALAQAELDLRQAELILEESQEPPDEVQVRAAQAAVDQAAASLELARLNVSSVLSGTMLNEALDDAERAFVEAQNQYQSTLAQYERGETVYWYVDQTQRAYEDAQLALARVRQQADLQLESANSSVSQAWDAYQQAQDSLQMLLEGADPRSVELARVDVERARLAVEAAQENLARATLTAPFDGFVYQVGVSVGEWVSPGAPAVGLLDTSIWLVETKNVGELEIAGVYVGQEAQVRVNAFPGETLLGRVVSISPLAVVQQGDTTYTLLIELEPTDLALLAGMTARVEITAAE